MRSKARKARGKTAKNGIYIRGFYDVSIADNLKPKRPRRDRMQFAYRYVVDGKEENDYNWVTLNDMFGHPEEEQFVGCLYELLAAYIGDAVNDLKTLGMQGADLLNKRCHILLMPIPCYGLTRSCHPALQKELQLVSVGHSTRSKQI
jgi:hypothetical protein